MATASRPQLMTFDRPLMLLAALALPWFWWIAAGRASSIGRARIVTRAAAALLLVLAAAGISVSTGSAPVTVVTVLDRSDSMPRRAQQEMLTRVKSFAEDMQTGDRLGVVVVGASATVALQPAERPDLDNLDLAIDGTGTDIGGALRLARSMLPTDGPRRIVLVSDGHDTTGRAERESLLAGAAGLPVDVVPMPVTNDVSALRVTRVIAPPDVAIGQPYAVSAELSGRPGTRATVVLYRDNASVGRQTITIAADGTASMAISERQLEAATIVYRAAVESEAGNAGSARGSVVVVEGEPTLLYVSNAPPAIGATLAGTGFHLTHVTPDEMSRTVDRLPAFSGVVLDDVPSESLRTATLEALTRYVEDDGGGLLMLGSARTLDLAGYPTTPLDRVLPIDLRPRTGERAPAVNLVLVFDKSGSMANDSDGVPKIQVARQAVMRAVDAMPATVGVGVLAFDSRPVPISPIRYDRDRSALASALQRVTPSGPTAIAVAVETALTWLRQAGPGARRQILLISDGRSDQRDSDRLRALARTGGAEISTVAIGPADRALLEDVAAASGGLAYFPDSLRELPRQVARAAVRSVGGGIVGERGTTRLGTHPALAGISPGAPPLLNGYVVAASRPTAVSLLRSQLDDPVLSAWRAGLGRVAVYTADLGSPWSRGLREWPENARLWTQTVRWLARRSTDPVITATIRDVESRPRVAVEGVRLDGTAVVLEQITALVRIPGGRDEDVPLVPTASGRYEGRLPVSAAGPYVVAVTARESGGGLEHRVVRALYWSADREGAEAGADLVALSRLAELTGGRVLPDAASPFDGSRPRGYRSISALAAALALTLFILEIAIGEQLAAFFTRSRRAAGRRADAAA